MNINDYVQEEKQVPIFNDGKAGKVTNVRVSVEVKKPTDKDNAPDYKLFFFDEKGASFNKGYYLPDENTSETRVKIEVLQLLSILESLNPEVDRSKFPKFNSKKEGYEYLISQIAQADLRNARINVFVTYGTKDKPSSYLGFRAYNVVEPVDTPESESKLTPNFSTDPDREGYNDVMERLTPTDFTDQESPSEKQEEEDSPMKWGS